MYLIRKTDKRVYTLFKFEEAIGTLTFKERFADDAVVKLLNGRTCIITAENRWFNKYGYVASDIGWVIKYCREPLKITFEYDHEGGAKEYVWFEANGSHFLIWENKKFEVVVERKFRIKNFSYETRILFPNALSFPEYIDIGLLLFSLFHATNKFYLKIGLSRVP